jgi:hypothetical protein
METRIESLAGVFFWALLALTVALYLLPMPDPSAVPGHAPRKVAGSP